MSTKTEQLRTLLVETRALLEQVGEQYWAGWAEDKIAYLDENVLDAVRSIISAYGGMGTLNDLVLHPVNGHSMTEKEINPINEKFDRLRNEIYELAYDVRGEEVNRNN